jgi:hypothetical protein
MSQTSQTTTTTTAAFKTNDLYRAAFLVSRGHVITRLDGSYRKVFVFPPDAAEDAEAYFRGATVEAVDFAHALKELKMRLFAHA